MSEALASLLLTQAAHCARLGSPLYADLLGRAAADAEVGGPVARVLEGHEKDPPSSMLALRLMGAVRRRALEGASPRLAPWFDSSGATYGPSGYKTRTAGGGSAWEAFRAAAVEDQAAIRRLLDRPVQTNEVGRCAALLPGFFAAARLGLPMRLLEVGASAGLNLGWDRYRYEADGFAWGGRESPVRVEFELEGPAPAAAAVEIGERRGCDPRPVDPASEEGRLTLLAFVWADQTARLRRLEAALDAAAQPPLPVDKAGAAEWVGERLAAPSIGMTTVVFHSIVMQYLPAGEREEFERQLRAAGEEASEEAPLAWLRMEPAGERAEVRLTLWPGGEERLLARVGYHGDPVQLLS